MTGDLPATVGKQRDCSKVPCHEGLQGSSVLTFGHGEVGIEVGGEGVGLRDLVDDDKWRTSWDWGEDCLDLETDENTRHDNC